MQYYKDRGLGGVVCNVAFRDYLRSEENWKTLVRGVEACRQLGMVVWIYDEEGYPSGAAGGLVLKENPAFEAQALAYDPSRPDPFVLRPAYEHTHASNNYHAARRYINLIDDRAVRSFIANTHDAYCAATATAFRQHDPGDVHRRAVADRREPRANSRERAQDASASSTRSTRASGRCRRCLGATTWPSDTASATART